MKDERDFEEEHSGTTREKANHKGRESNTLSEVYNLRKET